MVDTKIAPGRSRMAMVLKAIEERHDAGEPPFGDVLEVIDAIEGPGLTGFDICIAIPRLVRAGRIRYALDGIRMVAREDGTPPATVVRTRLVS